MCSDISKYLFCGQKNREREYPTDSHEKKILTRIILHSAPLSNVFVFWLYFRIYFMDFLVRYIFYFFFFSM